jgi:hypothetical protein
VVCHVSEAVMISPPGLGSSAAIAVWIAAVPDETVTACVAP